MSKDHDESNKHKYKYTLNDAIRWAWLTCRTYFTKSIRTRVAQSSLPPVSATRKNSHSFFVKGRITHPSVAASDKIVSCCQGFKFCRNPQTTLAEESTRIIIYRWYAIPLARYTQKGGWTINAPAGQVCPSCKFSFWTGFASPFARIAHLAYATQRFRRRGA